MTLWKGRISAGMADAVAAFTVSLPFDQALALDDLTGSRAHVKGLGKAGILTDNEVTTLLDALDQVAEELTTGTFAFAPEDEDVHTAVERRVTELAGEVGAKLHTGRSHPTTRVKPPICGCGAAVPSYRWRPRSWPSRARWRAMMTSEDSSCNTWISNPPISLRLCATWRHFRPASVTRRSTTTIDPRRR